MQQESQQFCACGIRWSVCRRFPTSTSAATLSGSSFERSFLWRVYGKEGRERGVRGGANAFTSPRRLGCVCLFTRFSTRGLIELIHLTLFRSSVPTGYTLSGGSYLHRCFLFAHFSCPMRSGMFSVEGKNFCAPSVPRAGSAGGAGHVSLFIRPQWRRVLGSRSENHNQQPTMRVFNSAGAGDPGHQGFPPSSSCDFPFRTSSSLLLPSSIAALSFERFPKSTTRAGDAPQQGHGISARLTGSVARRVPPRRALCACYLRDRGMGEERE